MLFKRFLSVRTNVRRNFNQFKVIDGILVAFCIISVVLYYHTNNIEQSTRSKNVRSNRLENKCFVTRPTSDEFEANAIDLEVKSLLEIESTLAEKHQLKNGGEFVPETSSFTVTDETEGDCTIIDNSKYKIAIIIPFRNRSEHLRIFLNNMHTYLMRQRLHYKIFLVEPHSNLTFNRGMLKNIGFVEAMKDSNKWNCFIFHDVDLIPENANTFYECNDYYPIHYASSHNNSNVTNQTNTEDRSQFFGGIVAFTKQQFIDVNGYSNLFYGWGSEDDDLYIKSIRSFSKILRLSEADGKYTMLQHPQEKPNHLRKKILYDYSRFTDPKKLEGLNNLPELYNITRIERNVLFTKYIVSYSANVAFLKKYH